MPRWCGFLLTWDTRAATAFAVTGPHLRAVLYLIEVIFVLRILGIHDEHHAPVNDPEYVLDISSFGQLALEHWSHTNSHEQANILTSLWCC
jgi:hypothetical protein